MMTHRQRILMATRGELPDILPYVPKIEIWYNANSLAGTLPERHKGRTLDEISLAEGWALHKVNPDYVDVRRPDALFHRAIGLFAVRQNAYRFRFSRDIDVEVKREGDTIQVKYHTPLGMVSTTTTITEDLRRGGATYPFIKEHIIKKLEDYRIVGYIFESLELVPDFDDFIHWQNEVGENGFCATMAAMAASPMHHIQKEFLDATAFFFHYKDHYKEMQALAESVGNFYNQVLRIISDSPAEAVLWGANFDDMITYAPYFEKEISPWMRKAADVLHAKGKVMISHCDGENLGLMDLIKNSGIDVAEAVCPYPMTKVRIEEYYESWSDKLTLFGGIPSNMLLAESATEDEFVAYLDHLFKVVIPGRRLILGIADTTPPNAAFDRLIRIGERVEKEGRLPLKGEAFRPVSERLMAKTVVGVMPKVVEDKEFKVIQENVFQGNHTEIKHHVQRMLREGVKAQEILQRGMIAAMDVICEKFKSGELFVPEVLLSARAMNEALPILEHHLASDHGDGAGKILIGTVRGDLHDLGKNIVIIMLRGVGFEVRDMGINVTTEEFVNQVYEYKPQILGLSALLTTTMPEMKKVIDALKAKGLKDSVKVIVGGAPVNEKFAKDIGADGYAPEAGEAVTLVKKLMKK